ncbi:extracellular solute-binding protein [bacterium]|nr:extracellular solute-binding protein [bacterium]
MQIWAHEGRAEERQVLTRQLDRFLEERPGRPCALVFLPEGSYNGQVQAAALASKLPDMLEFDGPLLYRYAWQGCLRPLDGFVNDRTRQNVLPSLIQQGSFRGRLYSLGCFDSGLGLYARKSVLRRVGARLPRGPADAWKMPEFNLLLKELAQVDEDGQVLDLKLNYQGEWFTYAFAPALTSGGADLGHLDQPEARSVLEHFQGWLQQNLVDPNLDDEAFVQGRVALSWSGHWEYPRYSQRWKDDLCLLPLPDFGRGSQSGQGSWNWALTRDCADPQRAAEFLEYLLQDTQVLEMTRANGAVPGTRSALARSELYGPKGPLRLFSTQLLQGFCSPRPASPAYPIFTSIFQQAVQDIFHGSSAQFVLEGAAARLHQDELDNEGYR